MYEVLKILHVVGWASWFGLAIAEASLGVQVRKATEAGGRDALARVWGRVGRIQVVTMAVAIVFGLALFGYMLSTAPEGGQAFMHEKARSYIHAMMGLGLVAGVLTLLAAGSRGRAIAAVGSPGFDGAYKRAAMFSGISSLLILGTIVEVYLRTL